MRWNYEHDEKKQLLHPLDMGKPEPSAADPIAREEWDFSGCPENQLRWCCYYEYLRSLKEVRQLFRRSERKTTVDNILLQGSLAKLVVFPDEEMVHVIGAEDRSLTATPFMLSSIAGVPEFPDVPWMRLPAKTRTRVTQGHNDLVRVIVEVTPHELGVQAAEAALYDRRRNDVRALITYPSAMSVAEIMDSVARQFKAHAAKHPTTFRLPKGRRGSYHDKLSQLAAWRLLKVLDPHEAPSFVQKRRGEHKPLYKDKYLFLGASKKAERLLSALLRRN
jgi:hypothetical protein